MTNSIRRLIPVFLLQAVVMAGVVLTALDLFAHKKLELLAGLNAWGYRGAVARRRQPREIRIVIVGGTRAFAPGMPAQWTTATVLRQQVMLVTDRKGGEIRQVVSLTLAHPGALPDSYAATIAHFAYLQPDYICIYDDLGVGGAVSLEETSGVYKATGYFPMLPLALQEKGMAWRFGNVRFGYERAAAKTQEPLIQRAAGAVVETLGDGLARADRMLARRAAARPAMAPDVYARQMSQAVASALERSRGVVVAVSPAETPLQADNLAALRPRVAAMLAATPALRFVDLSSEPALVDRSQRLDDWNYGGDAVAAAARAITPAMLQLIARSDREAARAR